MQTRESYQLWMIAATLACMVAGLFIVVNSSAQSPFNGIAIQEVPINAFDLPTIDAELDAGNGGPASARCWRIYVCMDDPDWELQAFWGNNFQQWHLGTSTAFYQTTGASYLAANNNPLFYGLVPGYEFDSWFTLGLDDNTSNTIFLQGLSNPMIDFETGTGFLVNDVDGASVFGTWLPPNSEGRPDADNKVLIAQLTTDGTFSGTMNFQFRRLNPDGTVYSPIEWIQVTGVYINGLAPGNAPDLCPIVFLPVELLHFHANPTNGQVALNWATASEVNNDYFTVERSADKENWDEVVRLDGNGSTNTMNQYSTMDPKPLIGTSYYRLKQTDTNGEYSHSHVVPVTFLSEELEIYPNPTSDIFYVQGDLSNVSIIQVLDGRGRVVSFDSQTNLSKEWNLAELGLERGVYFVEFILNSGVTVTEKLVLR